jgi:hypothetical protein
MTVAANLKFTGLVYGVILAGVAVSFARRQSWRARGDARLLGCALAAFTAASISPYAHNVLRHGDPFYPIHNVGIVRGGAKLNEDFLNRTRFTKFMISTFHSSDSFPGSVSIPRAQVVMPKLWHYMALAKSPDVRLAGFGSLFGWSLVVAGLALVSGLVAGRKTYPPRSRLPMLLLILWVLASSGLNPELWWARWVPQLWILPILVGSLLSMMGRNRLAALTIALPMMGSLLTLGCWMAAMPEQHRQTKERLALVEGARRVRVMDGWKDNHGIFTFAEHMQRNGSEVQLAQRDSTCDLQIGIVRVCRNAPE